MRAVIVAAAVIAFASPLRARADHGLTLTRLDGAPASPALHVEVSRLQLGSQPLLLDDGSGAGGGADPVLALVLGIIPGFGLGHYVAGSSQWTRWLIIDVLLLAGAIVLTAADIGALTALVWLAVVVERVIEGIDAYRAAGGKSVAGPSRERGRVALAPPAGGLDGPVAAPAVVALRF